MSSKTSKPTHIAEEDLLKQAIASFPTEEDKENKRFKVVSLNSLSGSCLKIKKTDDGSENDSKLDNVTSFSKPKGRS